MSGYKHIPYTQVDGVPTFKDSEIIGLYQRIWDEGLGPTLFHDGSIKNAAHFLQLMKGSGTILHVVVEEDGHPVALWWLNRIEQTHAYCHFCAFIELFATPDTKKIGKDAMKICFDGMGFKVIMGMLPSTNVIAIRYLGKVGMHVLGTVPNLMHTESGDGVEGTILYITREDLKDAY